MELKLEFQLENNGNSGRTGQGFGELSESNNRELFSGTF